MSAERRFDPTPTRRERARREGDVARSAEVTSLAAFACALAGAACALPGAAGTAAAALRGPLHGGVIAALASFALVPALAAGLGATFAAVAQGGGLHLAAVRIDAKRLDPVAGLRRMCGAEALLGATRGVVALACALAAAAATLAASPPPIAGAAPGALAAYAWRAAAVTALAALAPAAVFALVDLLVARHRWLRKLRMTHDELRRDAREHDGDPHLRGRRRTLHRTLLRGGVERTREASFVVVNPTHIAIALRYAPPATPVPEILVRAAGEAAGRVRAIAFAHDIPLIEDIPLARALYAAGESGSAIPRDCYVAVAHVVASLARSEARA